MKGPVSKSLLPLAPTKVKILDHERVPWIILDQPIRDRPNGRLDQSCQFLFKTIQSGAVSLETLTLTVRPKFFDFFVESVKGGLDGLAVKPAIRRCS